MKTQNETRLADLLIGCLILLTCFLAGSGTGNAPTTTRTVELPPPDRILIAYYSQMGHNAAVAKEIQKQIGGELFQIKTTTAYPKNVPGTLAQVKREYVEQVRPQMAADVPDFDKYDLVVLGYPNWYDAPPMGVLSFLEQHRWQGKTIAPYTSYGLSGYGTSIADIKRAVPEAQVVKGMALHASQTGNSAEPVRKWLRSLQWEREG